MSERPPVLDGGDRSRRRHGMGSKRRHAGVTGEEGVAPHHIAIRSVGSPFIVPPDSLSAVSGIELAHFEHVALAAQFLFQFGLRRKERQELRSEDRLVIGEQ